MQILLTLNSGLGADTGPNFNLTANVGSVSPSSATKSELLAGILVTIDDTATQVTVTSVGVCTTSINISVSGITTSTTTLAVTSFTLGYDNSNFFTSCTNYTSSPQTFYSTVGSTLIEGTILYDDIGLTSLSSNGYYSDGTNWWRITSGDGVIYSTGACATTTTTSTTTTVAPTTTSTTTTLAPTTTTSTSTTTLANAVFSLGYDATVGWQSCYAARTNYYSYAGDIVQNGTYLFTDITLSTKAPVGYYSDGANYYYVASICNEYTFTNTLGYDESVEYYDCSGNPQTLLVYDGTTSSAVCVDSITNLNGLTANNNGLGSCTPNSIGILQNATPCPTTSTTSTTSTSTSTTSTTTTTTAAPTTTTTTSGGGGTTSTTTTLSYTPFSLTYSNTAGATACTDYDTPTNRNVYYAGPGATLGTGTVLYTTSALTTPVANGYYSNGANYWNTAANAGNLQNQTVCAGVTSSTTSTTTTTTAAPTTTTTTTAAPVWYQLTNCANSSTSYSQEYPFGTFTNNDRVTSPGIVWVVTGYITADPGGTLYAITATGFTNCPSGTTTTTTTAAPTTTSTTTTTTTQPPTTTTTTTTTTTAAPPTTANINIATNGSLDISMDIDNITVNGVGPVSYTGVSPNTSGNGGNVITNQLGTYDIVVTYTATTGGQHIELVDSNGTTYCNNTGIGFNSMTFSGVVVNGTTDLVLTALDGTC